MVKDRRHPRPLGTGGDHSTGARGILWAFVRDAEEFLMGWSCPPVPSRILGKKSWEQGRGVS